MSYNKINPLQKFTPQDWSTTDSILNKVDMLIGGGSYIKAYGKYDYEKYKSSYDSYKASSSSYDSQQSTNQILSSYMMSTALS